MGKSVWVFSRDWSKKEQWQKGKREVKKKWFGRDLEVKDLITASKIKVWWVRRLSLGQKIIENE